ncbi:MAG: phenylalanine--tRNA ligase subunit beta, partial [Bacteroidota bacterium]
NPLRIVCGASNVAPGQKVPVATIGTTLFIKDQELKIKESKIRGELSQGMICAEDELGLGNSHQGIMVLEPEATPGTQASEYFKVQEDFVFEIGLTPNRSDATSHIGVARDLAAIISNQAGPAELTEVKYHYPDLGNFNTDNKKRPIEVIVEDQQACPRYSGLTITGFTVKDSPSWLKNRLLSIGLRPINNIVDVTNFVLHETGQPLHAFDADKISGNQVIVKKMPSGTHFVTLDNVERTLNDQDLMICNSQMPMCMAGLYGGIDSGVTEGTTSIFLESAYFDPKTIRKSSKRHGLQTDASFRFERGADFNMTVFALKRAAQLIKEIGGGEISSEIIDVYPAPFSPVLVNFSWKNLDRLAGIQIEHSHVQSIIQSLGIRILSENGEGLHLEIPAFKSDVLREVDVIEEVLRIFGYDRIDFSPQIKSSISHFVKPDKEKTRNIVSDFLSANGFLEIMNNSLTKSAYYLDNERCVPDNLVRIFNPLSRELDTMRQTLLFGGMESIVYNLNRKSPDLRFYELGKCYFLHPAIVSENLLEKISEELNLSFMITGKSENECWNTQQMSSSFYDLKGIADALLTITGKLDARPSLEHFSDSYFEYGLSYILGKQHLLFLGKVRKSILTRFDCKQELYYAELNWDMLIKHLQVKEQSFRELPKSPEVRRDLALLIDQAVNFSEIESIAYETERKLLKNINLFDVYEGDKIEPGKKSYALSFTLQDDEKTLKDEEIDKIMGKLLKSFERKLNAKLR